MPIIHHCGNLNSYRLYTQPTAKRLFGEVSFRKKKLVKHQENVQRLLEILALNGQMSTWDIAKVQYSDSSSIRTREKELRRLIIGRKDRGRKSLGILDVGLVVSNRVKINEKITNSYRLSLHGILYCLDIFNMEKNEVDKIAYQYSEILPMVFGKWDYLKDILGEAVYSIKLLAEGLFLDNLHITKISKIPIFEMITYLNLKYQDFYEEIEEKDLADQISYWFYTTLLISFSLNKENQKEMQKWKKIFEQDSKLKKWYFDFVRESSKFYSDRFDFVKLLEP